MLAEGAPLLSYFYAYGNKFSGSIPASIGRLTALKYLALNNKCVRRAAGARLQRRAVRPGLTRRGCGGRGGAAS